MSDQLTLGAMLLFVWLSKPSNNKQVNLLVHLYATVTLVAGFAVGAFV